MNTVTVLDHKLQVTITKPLGYIQGVVLKISSYKISVLQFFNLFQVDLLLNDRDQVHHNSIISKLDNGYKAGTGNSVKYTVSTLGDSMLRIREGE